MENTGFNAVPLAATDMLPALQTGMVNAYSTTAIMSLASQWFAFTPYMRDLPWAPLVGATVVSKHVWDRIPEKLKPELERIAAESGRKLQTEVRLLEIEAIKEMTKRGLKILTLGNNGDRIKMDVLACFKCHAASCWGVDGYFFSDCDCRSAFGAGWPGLWCEPCSSGDHFSG